jgi:hypothetical protein
MSVFLYSSHQTGRDDFSSYGFPSLQSFVISVRRCSHMTGFAEQLCIRFDIFAPIPAGFDVVQIEVHRAPAAFTCGSTFCHHFLFHRGPNIFPPQNPRLYIRSSGKGA